MRSLAAFTGLALLAACQQSLPEHCQGVSLAIRDADGLRPADFQITLRPGDDLALADYCDGNHSTTGVVTCNDAGVFFHTTAETLAVVIKARGQKTYRSRPGITYDDSDPTCPAGAALARLEADLTALPPFESTADYTTGFAAETGRDDFAALAVEVPGELGLSLAVKFYLEEIHGEPTVYFQNTKLHPLHYGFVRSVLGRAISMSDYEAQTYHGEDRAQMAGTIVSYPALEVSSSAWGPSFSAPLAVEFFPSDDLSPQLALLAYGLLEERLLFVPLLGTAERLFYIPAGATQDSALTAAAQELRAESALWLHPEELYSAVDLQILNPGVACGTLQRLTPESLAVTPVSYRDILVLTRLPNTLPIVGGTITEELQTPLAHVNVAARSRGTPNIALRGAGADSRVAPFVGELVRFTVAAGTFDLAEISLPEAEAFWSTLIPTDPYVPSADLITTGLLPFADIGFAWAQTVGVKAANVAELSQLLPDIAPDGFAVPFGYYESFMSDTTFTAALCEQAELDCGAEGRNPATCAAVGDFCDVSGVAAATLNSYRDRLLDDATFRTDSAFREAALDGLQYLLRHLPVDTDFGASLDTEVSTRFGTQPVRLRSSTNAEDLEQFSGAGLYQSFTAQAESDRLASSRIRRVWASVWSWSAFEERSFWNIDHRAVKMGVAVHRSFPDEAANGVLITQNIADCALTGFYVNVQLGEVSVTNPEGGTLPEIFSLVNGATGLEVIRQRFSSLSLDVPIMTAEETQALFVAASAVQNHFAVLYGANPSELALELEFKLDKPARDLVIKQVRPFFVRGGGIGCP